MAARSCCSRSGLGEERMPSSTCSSQRRQSHRKVWMSATATLNSGSTLQITCHCRMNCPNLWPNWSSWPQRSKNSASKDTSCSRTEQTNAVPASIAGSDHGAVGIDGALAEEDFEVVQHLGVADHGIAAGDLEGGRIKGQAEQGGANFLTLNGVKDHRAVIDCFNIHVCFPCRLLPIPGKFFTNPPPAWPAKARSAGTFFPYRRIEHFSGQQPDKSAKGCNRPLTAGGSSRIRQGAPVKADTQWGGRWTAWLNLALPRPSLQGNDWK